MSRDHRNVVVALDLIDRRELATLVFERGTFFQILQYHVPAERLVDAVMRARAECGPCVLGAEESAHHDHDCIRLHMPDQAHERQPSATITQVDVDEGDVNRLASNDLNRFTGTIGHNYIPRSSERALRAA
jgi:hypothetical protein